MLLTKWRTLWALGPSNLARVGIYRIGLKSGLHPVMRLQGESPKGIFFMPCTATPVSLPDNPAWGTEAFLFSRWPIAINSTPPDWLANPITGTRIQGADRPWWQIPDFDPAVGDIKLIWELSRMDWLLPMAQRARQGRADELQRINDWLDDWCHRNPPYAGPNWKCGQEASLRVLHLAAAALILSQTRAAAQGFTDLLVLHLQRIAPTVQYAMAQDNNHGTSEAAALFVGGSWLASMGDARGHPWAEQGRQLFENRARRLIAADGSFSQYSLNYHRLMLDTASLAEVWRRHLKLPPFSDVWQARMRAAAQWLWTLTDPATGDAPNMGANDGARILQLTGTPYRDHRPSVQLAMALFDNTCAYEEAGPWDDHLTWLGVAAPQTSPAAQASRSFLDGGYHLLRQGRAMALMRFPRFRFRPSQADALHVDFWVNGCSHLRDGGTYSYNTEDQWLNYFGGTAGHNTIEFDGRDQMPRLSRFLFGGWLQSCKVEDVASSNGAVRAGAAYRDAQSVRHLRQLSLSVTQLTVADQFSGFHDKAVLRWRLQPGKWQWHSAPANAASDVAGELVGANGHILRIRTTLPLRRCELLMGWESLHYLEKTEVPVLEIEINQPGSITTEYIWTS